MSGNWIGMIRTGFKGKAFAHTSSFKSLDERDAAVEYFENPEYLRGRTLVSVTFREDNRNTKTGRRI